MSQEKVDRRKEYKKNRKQIMEKQKRKNRIGKFVAYLCLLCVVGGVGFSFYQKLTPEKEANTDTFYNLIATDSYGFLDPSLSD